MPDSKHKSLHYALKNRERFLQELKDFLSIPSISTDPNHKEDIQKAAKWIFSLLTALGCINTRIYPTKGHPIVYGELNTPRPNANTLLVYGHYDVQPDEPIELWNSPPFEPKIQTGYLYARGASDMKGQILAVTKALESVQAFSELPINIKFVLEGEEEIGSLNFEQFITEHIDLLECDYALVLDTSMVGIDAPSITYALRGIAAIEIWVRGPENDLHSGVFGGIIQNPAHVLSELIAGLHDGNGKITLPGFYDDVINLNDEERSFLTMLPTTDETYLKQAKVPSLYGEKGYSAIERATARPTLDVNGMVSGFTGTGSKTIIPSWAMAKITMRLVPDQDPQKIQSQFKEYISQNAPATITWEVIPQGHGPASISPYDTPIVKAFSLALEEAWGKPSYIKREGGSVPIVGILNRVLNVDTLLSGFALPDDNAHGPNERLHLESWANGINALINFFYKLDKIKTWQKN